MVLGNIIIHNLIYACRQRPPKGRPYRLVVDEAGLLRNGPSDDVLNRMRAYGLWLLLVVQSLNQLGRSRDGYMDLRLLESVLTNASYLCAFQDIPDKRILANIIFPITGTKQVGTRTSGDPLLLATQAEENANEHYFTDLGKREVICWNRHTNQVVFGRTPDVLMDEADLSQILEFESQHLQATGVPIATIKEEIMARWARIDNMFNLPSSPAERPFGRQA